MIKVYVGRAMTGRVKEDVVKEAVADKLLLESAGFKVLDPVAAEGVQPTHEKLQAPKYLMDLFWPRDKAMIREANIVFIMSPNVASLGCIREYGYARYHLWKKVITVFPSGQLPYDGSVCYLEDDYVTDDLRDAIMEAYRTHGTLWKRLKWRLNLYSRCWFKAVWNRLKEWK